MDNIVNNANDISGEEYSNITDTDDGLSENQDTFVPVINVYSNKNSFCVKDTVFAVLFLVIGFVIVRLFTISGQVLVSGYYHMIILAMGMISLIYIKKHPDTQGIVFYGCSVLFCIVPLFSSSETVRFLSWVYAAVLLCLFAYSNSAKEKMFSRNFLLKALSAVFSEPFKRFSYAPRALAEPFRKSGKFGKNLLLIVAGLLISVPVTLIVVLILSDADENFHNLASGILNSISDNLGLNLLKFILSLPLSFMLFSILTGATDSRKNNDYDLSSVKIVPTIIICTAITPVIISYILFFICQLPYFLGAFSGILPDGYSYSEYARQGFFELCTVSVINLFILAFIFLFSKKSEKGNTIKKIFSVIFCIMTLTLIASALSKMILYIGEYGLTQLRLYTSWFMLLLAAVFIVVILSQIINKLPTAKLLFASFTIMLGLLCYCDPDRMIAKYNVDLYLNGVSSGAEINSMYGLSDSASSQIERLIGTDEEAAAKAWLEECEQDNRLNDMYFPVLFRF